MSVSKIFITLAAPALLTLSACGTPGFKANVARFQAMPAPQGQSFVIQAADPMNRGGLEFSQYSQRVRQHLLAQGYTEAPSAQAASLLVMLDYGVDGGKEGDDEAMHAPSTLLRGAARSRARPRRGAASVQRILSFARERLTFQVGGPQT